MKRLRDLLRSVKRSVPAGPVPDGSAASRSSGPGEFLGSYSIEVDDRVFDRLAVIVKGRISMDNAESLREDVVRIIEYEPLKNVTMDLGGVEYFDSAGAAILIDLRRRCAQRGNSLKLTSVPERIRRFIDVVDITAAPASKVLAPPAKPGIITEMGEGALHFAGTARDILTFIGASLVALAQDLSRPRKVRWEGLWKLLEKSGSDAVPVVTLLSFLQGAILAFQAAIQLRKFGANIFVADLVSVSICLEMGPLLTALIVSGRSGAAYAAHIGTMQVTEEVDALRVMAIDPMRYLVSPRILAVAISLPCLTLFADIVGIVGGCVVAVLSLDLTPTGYFNQVHKVLEVSDVAKGLLKSFVFGIEIAMIGCFRGFQVRGGAESVGRATTSAVVTCIFCLTITDAFFSVLYYYLPLAWKGLQ